MFDDVEKNDGVKAFIWEVYIENITFDVFRMYRWLPAFVQFYIWGKIIHSDEVCVRTDPIFHSADGRICAATTGTLVSSNSAISR